MGPSDEGPVSAAEVACAARRTLAQRGVRVSEVAFEDPAPPGGEAWTSRSEGVADLAGRRARLRSTFAAEERFAQSEGEEDRGELFFIGGSSTWGWDDRWTPFDGIESGERRRGDPGWILEQLADGQLEDLRAIGEEVVRSVACRRVGAAVTTSASPDTVHHRIYAETWIGEDGLIRRVTHTKLRDWRGRPRSPLRRGDDGGRSWQTLELWDFGIPVDIPTPPAPPASDESLAKVTLDIWRMSRRERRERT